MPRFYEDVEVDIDIDIDDFLNACDKADIKEIVQALKEDGHIKGYFITSDNPKPSLIEQEFDNTINKIHKNRLRLTNEEEELLKKIADRF